MHFSEKVKEIDFKSTEKRHNSSDQESNEEESQIFSLHDEGLQIIKPGQKYQTERIQLELDSPYDRKQRSSVGHYSTQKIEIEEALCPSIENSSVKNLKMRQSRKVMQLNNEIGEKK